MTRYLADVRDPGLLSAREVERLDWAHKSARFDGFQVFCADCLGDSSCCKNDKPSKPTTHFQRLRALLRGT